MDQKLLLSFQYASNVAGLTVPWDEIGRVMGERITGSAVIQHLAKTRIRMQKRGLQVPPPLRRGGGGSSRIPATEIAAAPTTAATADKSNLKAKTKAKTTPRKAKKATKKGNTLSDDSGSDDDWKDDDSDAEYGGPAAKRAKSTKGPMKRKIKTEDSDDENIPLSKAPKRKASDFKPSEERSAFGHTDINGVPIDDDMETEDEIMVGSGEPWLELDEDNGKSTTSKKTPVKKTLVVSLPTTPAKTDMFKTGDHENNVVGDVQAGYQIENHGDPFTNGSTEGLINTNGYGGAYGNNGGFQSQDGNHDGAFPGSFVVDGGYDTNVANTFGTDTFGTNMTGDGSISDSYHFGSGSTVPYPIQTSWPDQGSMESSSYYPSLDQTPAATSAGADFGGGYFENSQFDIGSFSDASYDFAANNSNLFNPDEVDGNFVNDGYFGSNTYGN